MSEKILKRTANERRFNHAFDVAFEVVAPVQDWGDITAAEILAALKLRVKYLEEHPEEILDACSGYDVYEEEQP
jgi:hypothetical protein